MEKHTHVWTNTHMGTDTFAQMHERIDTYVSALRNAHTDTCMNTHTHTPAFPTTTGRTEMELSFQVGFLHTAFQEQNFQSLNSAALVPLRVEPKTPADSAMLDKAEIQGRLSRGETQPYLPKKLKTTGHSSFSTFGDAQRGLKGTIIGNSGKV